jgi:hypothetical protein
MKKRIIEVTLMMSILLPVAGVSEMVQDKLGDEKAGTKKSDGVSDEKAGTKRNDHAPAAKPPASYDRAPARAVYHDGPARQHGPPPVMGQRKPRAVAEKDTIKGSEKAGTKEGTSKAGAKEGKKPTPKPTVGNEKGAAKKM